MRIVFFGTPDYVIPILERLNKNFRDKNEKQPITAVVTQKPKPVGRKQLLEYSPVDKWAHKKNVPIFFDSIELIKQNVQADIGILAAYGEIIPEKVIKSFLHGIINIHFSLLPELRGASPVESAIVSGRKEIGVTIFKIDDKLDHGPIVSQFKEEIREEDTTETLRKRLFEKSAEILTTLLPAYISGKITLREQDHKKASYTREIKKNDAFIPPVVLQSVLDGKKSAKDWVISFIKNYSLVPSAYSLERFIRAMQPWPVSWTYVQLGERLKVKGKRLKRLKILKAHVEISPPTTHDSQNTKHKLVLDEVQLEGKNPVTWRQFNQGYPNFSFDN